MAAAARGTTGVQPPGAAQRRELLQAAPAPPINSAGDLLGALQSIQGDFGSSPGGGNQTQPAPPGAPPAAPPAGKSKCMQQPVQQSVECLEQCVGVGHCQGEHIAH